jgi:acyl-CoA oxidase
VNLQGTAEQIAYRITLSESGKITGSYTQTDLAHGSFISGIETTATLQKETYEFIIHSPTLTSTKYGPQAVGCAFYHTILNGSNND